MGLVGTTQHDRKVRIATEVRRTASEVVCDIVVEGWERTDWGGDDGWRWAIEWSARVSQSAAEPTMADVLFLVMQYAHRKDTKIDGLPDTFKDPDVIKQATERFSRYEQEHYERGLAAADESRHIALAKIEAAHSATIARLDATHEKYKAVLE